MSFCLRLCEFSLVVRCHSNKPLDRCLFIFMLHCRVLEDLIVKSEKCAVVAQNVVVLFCERARSTRKFLNNKALK